MTEEQKKDLALTIASMNGSYGRDFGDGVVETSKIYKELTGIDLGIKSLKQTNDEIKNKKKSWWKRIFN